MLPQNPVRHCLQSSADVGIVCVDPLSLLVGTLPMDHRSEDESPAALSLRLPTFGFPELQLGGVGGINYPRSSPAPDE